jgi:large subunit ribosomal protein L3
VKGIIGKKIGMTSMFMEDGTSVACTLVEAGPCVVTQIKTHDLDGYSAVQLGYGERKPKNTSNGLKGHLAKAATTPKAKLAEIRDFSLETKEGETISVGIFEAGDMVEVIGTSKGKGFQGVVKRHGFSGVGSRTHGQHDRERAPGSMGGSSYPSRVLRGLRMAGQTGNTRVKTTGHKILKVLADQNVLVLSGTIAGARGNYVIVQTRKK